VLGATHSIAAAYNALVMFSFAASGWAVYRLARHLGGSRAAAFLAGLLYAVAPYRLSNLGNLNQLQTEWVPLGVLFGLRSAETLRTRDLVALAATIAVQSFFGWYYTFHLVFALTVLAVFAAWLRWPVAAKPPWRRVGIAIVATGVAVAPGAWPYW